MEAWIPAGSTRIPAVNSQTHEKLIGLKSPDRKRAKRRELDLSRTSTSRTSILASSSAHINTDAAQASSITEKLTAFERKFGRCRPNTLDARVRYERLPFTGEVRFYFAGQKYNSRWDVDKAVKRADSIAAKQRSRTPAWQILHPQHGAEVQPSRHYALEAEAALADRENKIGRDKSRDTYAPAYTSYSNPSLAWTAHASPSTGHAEHSGRASGNIPSTDAIGTSTVHRPRPALDEHRLRASNPTSVPGLGSEALVSAVKHGVRGGHSGGGASWARSLRSAAKLPSSRSARKSTGSAIAAGCRASARSSGHAASVAGISATPGRGGATEGGGKRGRGADGQDGANAGAGSSVRVLSTLGSPQFSRLLRTLQTQEAEAEGVQRQFERASNVGEYSRLVQQGATAQTGDRNDGESTMNSGSAGAADVNQRRALSAHVAALEHRFATEEGERRAEV